MTIDSHQHFWRPDRADYGWLTPDLKTLYRDYLPKDLVPILSRYGIERTILVQAAPTKEETHFMLSLADENTLIAGVVGWTDFESPLVGERIANLAANRRLVGFRPMVQDIADDDWLAKRELVPAFESCIENGLVFDALVLPRHLPRLKTVVTRHPDLKVVIDHAAKPTLKSGVEKSWFDDMAALARYSNVSCKLSGLVTEARTDWTTGDLVPIVDHLLQTFGPDRLLWGSDWPVLNLACSYERWWEAAQDLTASLTKTERDAIFGGNASSLYLGDRGRN